jgi:hypothetical protein
MTYQYSKGGELAYELDTDLLVCVIREFDRPADEIFVNLDEGLTVNDLYYECSPSDAVYGVVYLQAVDNSSVGKSRHELVEMDREGRYDYLWHSEVQVMSLPESRLRFQEWLLPN